MTSQRYLFDMKSKICFKCNIEQSIDNYYVHKQMADGHFNKCKSCTKKDSSVRSIPRTCVICKENFMTWPQEIKRGGGLTCSRQCYYSRLKLIVKKEEKSPNWKGDNVQYDGLHDWVRRQLGKPSKCEHCDTTTARLYDWSNISGEYKRDISDWQRLCRKCHIKYDSIPDKRKVTIIKKFGTLDYGDRDNMGRFS